MGPVTTKVVVEMNGIRYQEDEAVDVVRQVMERNDIQFESVTLLHATPAGSVKPKKKTVKKRTKTPSRKKTARKKTTRKV